MDNQCLLARYLGVLLDQPVASLYFLETTAAPAFFDVMTLLCITVLFSSFAERTGQVASAISGVGNSLASTISEVQMNTKRVYSMGKQGLKGKMMKGYQKLEDKAYNKMTGDSALDKADQKLSDRVADKAKELDEKGVVGAERDKELTQFAQDAAKDLQEESDGALKASDMESRALHHAQSNKSKGD